MMEVERRFESDKGEQGDVNSKSWAAFREKHKIHSIESGAVCVSGHVAGITE